MYFPFPTPQVQILKAIPVLLLRFRLLFLEESFCSPRLTGRNPTAKSTSIGVLLLPKARLDGRILFC